MSIKNWPGGRISPTPPTPSGSFENSTASGVWTLDQQAYWKAQNQWPTAGNIAPDSFFENVTMLLHGDGTNGAQNNTFLDSSTNNFTITRNGSTTQGSFSPYGPNWSNYFVRSASSYITFSDSSAFSLGTSDFTIECWIFPTLSGFTQDISGQANSSITTTTRSFLLQIDGAGSIVAGVWVGSTGYTITSSSPISFNTWNHIAFVRSSGTLTLYVNGVSAGTSSISTASVNDSSNNLSIGRFGERNAAYFDGYVSNFRMVVGTAIYTGAFTPSTAPLTAISGTSLLTCQSNRFRDASSNNFATTPANTPTVQRFSPFAPPAAYSTATIGGSGYFPAGGSQGSTSTRPLAVPNNSAFNLSGNFTVEVWHYGDSFTYSGGNNVVFLGADFGASRNQQIGLSTANDAMVIYHPSSGIQSSSTISGVLGSWNHYAYVRSGSTVTFYFNGINVGSVTNSVTFQMENGAFGALGGYGGRPAGYLTDLRVSNGAVLYTTNFTPPSAPISATGSTTCLLGMTNGAIFDNAMMNDLETVGNAQISTSVVKFGTGSMAFDGSGDSLKGIAASPNFQFGTGDFTVECWVYTANLAAFQTLLDARPSDTQSAYGLFINNSAFPYWYDASGLSTSSVAVSSNTWTHVAVSRASGTLRVFVNGTSGFSGSNTNAQNPTGNMVVGMNISGSAPYSGYIDDLRITKGVARYTANFTPPTAAFPNF